MTLTERRRGLMGAKKAGSRLPAEYQEVEWIENKSNGYIATNLYNSEAATSYIDVVCKPGRTSSADDVIVAACDAFSCDWQNGKYAVYNTSILSQSIGDVSDEVRWRTNNKYTSYPISIFSYRSTTSSHPFPGKLFSLCITKNGDKTLDAVPCYRKSDTKIGVYDLVTGTFFVGANQSAFTKGADVK